MQSRRRGMGCLRGTDDQEGVGGWAGGVKVGLGAAEEQVVKVEIDLGAPV